ELQAEQDGPAELLAEVTVGAGLTMAEPGRGSADADQHADDDDGDPGGVDNLAGPDDRVVIVHGAPLSACPFGIPGMPGVPVRMIFIPGRDLERLLRGPGRVLAAAL